LAVRIPENRAFLSQDITVAVQDEVTTGALYGQVVDFQDRSPLEGVQIALTDLGRETVTNGQGRFRFADLPTGRHVLETVTLGRAPVVDTVLIRPDQPMEVELRLPMEALEVKGISVEVIGRREMELRQDGFSGGRLDYVTPEEMDEIRDRVTDVVDVIRSQGSPRIRITDRSTGGVPMGFCISWTRREASVQAGRLRSGEGNDGCANMLIVLDGMPLQNVGGAGPTIPATEFLLDLTPEEIESVRVLSPVQARFQYGAMGDRGALIIETRRGGGGG
jgi:hypothetical protein